MKKNYLSLFILLYLFSCGKVVDTNPKKDEAASCFQSLIEEARSGSYESVAGAHMTVLCPKLNIDWSGATGFDSKIKKDSLKTDQAFRIASITKTVVATAILKLHETDRLSINDPISEYIFNNHIELLKEGNYDPDQILIKHCLNHTSGLYDYAMNESYAEIIRQNPQKRWSRTDQLNHSIKFGEKIGEAGEQYKYSDTGYILLGEIIENITGKNLGVALREIIDYDKLDMKKTWLEIMEPAPDSSKRVSRYFKRDDVTDWDASIDLYGGGGLVSTTQDLAKFAQALFNHEIYNKKETLDLMLTKANYAESYNFKEDRRYKDYRYGMWQHDMFGTKVYMHGGLWGIAMVHIPEYNSSIAINYTNGRWERLLKKTVLTIKNLHENQK